MRRKQNLPKKSEIFKYWKEWLDLNAFDWGEPSCWACGFGFNGKYNLKDSKVSPEKIAMLWNKAPLQRCHIVPESLGGSSKPQNLFLMCRECHDLAPNTAFPEIFFQWVKGQDHFTRRMNEYRELITIFDLGVEDSNIDALLDQMNSKEFRDWLHSNCGLHWNQKGLGNKLTPSTFVGLYWKYIKHGNKKQ